MSSRPRAALGWALMAWSSACSESSLGRLRVPADVVVDDAADRVDIPTDRLAPLYCEEAPPRGFEALAGAATERTVRLVGPRDVGVVERWAGGDSLADGDDAVLLLPGGGCAGGAAYRGFRERAREGGVAETGEACVGGLRAISSIELGYNSNFRGACIHGESEGGAQSWILRMRTEFWRPESFMRLPPGSARCAFGQQSGAAVGVDAANVRWSQPLDFDIRPVGEPAALADLDAGILSPVALLLASNERWMLWSSSPSSRWVAERLPLDGGSLAHQQLGPVDGREAIAVLDSRSRSPGFLSVVRARTGRGEFVDILLSCPAGATRARGVVDGVYSAARLVPLGDRYVLVLQSGGAGKTGLLVTEIDREFTSRTPLQTVEEGDGLSLVDVTAVNNPGEVVLWYARHRSDGTAMLRVGRLTFGL